MDFDFQAGPAYIYLCVCVADGGGDYPLGRRLISSPYPILIWFLPSKMFDSISFLFLPDMI